jgi:copper chaperone CopZ
MEGAHAHHEGGGAMSTFELVCAIALLAVLVNALRPRRREDGVETMSAEDEEVVELEVNGMRCNGCVTSVQRALSEIAGVTDAEVRLEEGRARVRGSGISVQELIDAVTSLGFNAHSLGAADT